MNPPPLRDPFAINATAPRRVRPLLAVGVLVTAVVVALAAGMALQRIELIELWQRLQPGGLPQAEPLPGLVCQPHGAELVCAWPASARVGLPEPWADLQLHLPQPLFPLKPFTLVLEGAVGLDSAVADFTMPGMYMGVNRYVLRPESDAAAVWRAEVTLPVCTAARTDWLLTLLVQQGGRYWQTELTLQVEASLHRVGGG